MKSYLSRRDRVDEFVGHLATAHLRFQIVRRDFRARHEDAIFAGVRLFVAAGEEEGDVRVFLGFGDAQLFEMQFGEVFAE